MVNKPSGLDVGALDTLTVSRYFFDMRHSPAIPAFILIVMVMFAGFFIWAATAETEDVVKTQAMLRPVRIISAIRCLTSGEIAQKSYEQDSFVKAGDLLLRIDSVSDELELRNSRQSISLIDSNIDDNIVLLMTIRKNANCAERDKGRAWLLCENYCGEYIRLQGQYDQLALKLSRERVKPANMQTPQLIDDLISDLERSKKNTDVWRNNQLLQTEDKIKSLQQTRDNLERRIADLERNVSNATIYAPISGRIDETKKVNEGDCIIAGDEIFRIIPESGETLKAEIIADPANIARIKKGQTVKLRFPGLPPSQFGQLEGIISLIPADVSVTGSAAFFLVEAEIPEAVLVSSSGEKIRLRPGISAEGRIIISRDTVLRMLLRKLDFLK